MTLQPHHFALSAAAGQRAHAVGTVTADGAVVVCERAEHRLMLAE